MQSLYRLHNCNFSFFYFTGTNAITVTMKANKFNESSTTAAVVKGITFIFPAYMWIESFIYMEWLYTWSSDLNYSWNICEIW